MLLCMHGRYHIHFLRSINRAREFEPPRLLLRASIYTVHQYAHTRVRTRFSTALIPSASSSPRRPLQLSTFLAISVHSVLFCELRNAQFFSATARVKCFYVCDRAGHATVQNVEVVGALGVAGVAPARARGLQALACSATRSQP